MRKDFAITAVNDFQHFHYFAIFTVSPITEMCCGQLMHIITTSGADSMGHGGTFYKWPFTNFYQAFTSLLKMAGHREHRE